MAGLVAACLVGGALLLCLWPLLAADERREGEELRRLLAEREAERDRLLAALKDVDLDRQMGKLSDEDHARMKAGLEHQALAVIAAIEADEERVRGADAERARAAGARPEAGEASDAATRPAADDDDEKEKGDGGVRSDAAVETGGAPADPDAPTTR